MLLIRCQASLRRRKPIEMMETAMPNRMPMEPNPNLMQMPTEKQFDESTGKKCKYSAYLNYTEVKRWSTPAQIPYWSSHKSIMKSTLS